MKTDVGALISSLDNPSTDIAQDAKHALIGRGAGAITRLADALTGLGRYGKLSAIEIFEACGDRRAGPALIDLLSDPDTTVREWAANALSTLRYAEAGPALAQLHARLVRDLVPPDSTEPVAVRNALLSFGLRSRLTPVLSLALAQGVGDGNRWPVARLPEVLRDLADHDQVVLYFMVWRVGDDGQLYWTQHENAGWMFDYTVPWRQNVTEARDAALMEAGFVQDSRDLVASIEWIDESDIAG